MTPDLDIRIKNETRNSGLSESHLKSVVGKMLKALGWRRAGVSILLTGDRKIRILNRRFLKHDRPTDVIAFSALEGPSPKPRQDLPVFLGDIVVSLDTTRRQAKIYGNDFFYELAFYICHGILHVMGYDDKTEKEAGKMLRKQARILAEIRIKNHGYSKN